MSPAPVLAPAAPALRCPRCSGTMTAYVRSGIAIDQCPDCRGMFLDRGELERLVEAEGGAWLGPVESRSIAPGAGGARAVAYRSDWTD